VIEYRSQNQLIRLSANKFMQI